MQMSHSFVIDGYGTAYLKTDTGWNSCSLDKETETNQATVEIYVSISYSTVFLLSKQPFSNTSRL